MSSPPTRPQAQAAAEARNTATTRRWLLDVFNHKRIEDVPGIISPRYVNVGTTDRTGVPAGEDVIRQADTWAPDRRIEIKYLVAQGDLVMILFRLYGTHTGPFAGVEPTGAPFSVWLSDIFRFDEDGMMTEGWVIGKGDLRTELLRNA
ncbi:ester cyclase [Streptomyces sp. DSM 44917]|uniref:Ester cyclase n=1 Tax=Streptomyces boetiae TaxID=3075541 RepID=A0ABU2L6Y5_9ACTN|nr:ester cyclase [Streptomyces sp. DSM 44917]MDT0307334.1 ester cyclase [Streptomyces sp. DSM 44917]